jgi:hypothetical protein
VCYDGLEILGFPVGSDEFIAAYLGDKAAKVLLILDKIQDCVTQGVWDSSWACPGALPNAEGLCGTHAAPPAKSREAGPYPGWVVGSGPKDPNDICQDLWDLTRGAHGEDIGHGGHLRGADAGLLSIETNGGGGSSGIVM